MSAAKKSFGSNDLPPVAAPLLNEMRASVGSTPVQIGAFEAKTHLARILDEAAAGKSYIVTKRGRPVAEIRPIAPTAPKTRVLGTWKGKGWMSPDFDAPLEDFKETME